MSYNGIGLQTPRGSGTSGHVQKNLTGKRNEGLRHKREREAHEQTLREVKARKKEIRSGARTEIIAHDQKRLIEVKCMELRDSLEDEDVADEEVDRRVAELRTKLTQQTKAKSSEKESASADTQPKLEVESVRSKLEQKEAKVESPKRQGDGQKENHSTLSAAANTKEPIEGPESQVEDAANLKKGSKSTYEYVPRYANR